MRGQLKSLMILLLLTLENIALFSNSRIDSSRIHRAGRVRSESQSDGFLSFPSGVERERGLSVKGLDSTATGAISSWGAPGAVQKPPSI